MHVRDVMTLAPVFVEPACSLRAAREQLEKYRIHHLLVVDDENVVGVLSYHHLIGGMDDLTAADVMSRDVVTLAPNDTLRSAASRLLGRSHGCAAVVNAGAVAGVVTTTDLLHAIGANGPRGHA
jgi:acetoin utilization protein AcuB